MRQTSRRDAFRVRHEALGACHLVEAQRIAHRLRLHKVGEFEIVFHVEPCRASTTATGEDSTSMSL